MVFVRSQDFSKIVPFLLGIVIIFLYFKVNHILNLNIKTMNWKSVIAGVITALLALAVWEMFVKNIVIKNTYEGYFEGDNFDYSEYKMAS